MIAVTVVLPITCRAQVNYVAQFKMDKQKFLVGEPIVCTFVIQNTGTQPFSFRYRSPDRALTRGLEGEPQFRVTGASPSPLPDPAPHPCGGEKGSVVYGSVRLAPGNIHSERWLLNQWARFSKPGYYDTKAERRLPLYTTEPGTADFIDSPAAYATASHDFAFEVVSSTENDLRAAFQPYLRTLEDSASTDPAEAVVVLTTLPQTFCLQELESLASAPAAEHRWDRSRALDGLARLGTPEAWNAIVKIARGEPADESIRVRTAATQLDVSQRAYAILLLSEKADPAFLSTLLKISASASGEVRGDALRALGFFRDPRAPQALFESLHSSSSTDRVNAILGLKNRGRKDSIPALLAILQDSDAEVRQVANFALQGLTGQMFLLSPFAGRAESDRLAARWHKWWQEHEASFVPPRQRACHEW
jgi:hypothetical protein